MFPWTVLFSQDWAETWVESIKVKKMSFIVTWVNLDFQKCLYVFSTINTYNQNR